MRHRKSGRKFNRTPAHREAMLRNLVCNLFEHGRVKTTVPRAKEARKLAERCITYAKKGLSALAEGEAEIPKLRERGAELRKKLEGASDEERRELQKQIDRSGKQIAALQARGNHFRRLALSRLHRKNVVKQLFEDIAPNYGDRTGGYTRVLKAGFRKGDNAPRAVFELV